MSDNSDEFLSNRECITRVAMAKVGVENDQEEVSVASSQQRVYVWWSQTDEREEKEGVCVRNVFIPSRPLQRALPAFPW